MKGTGAHPRVLLIHGLGVAASTSLGVLEGRQVKTANIVAAQEGLLNG